MNRYKNNVILTDSIYDSMVRYKYATSELCSNIYKACDNGDISYKNYYFKQNDRLDHIAGIYYNNGLDWWIIAAASGISWWLQINPGTIIRIPDREQITRNFNL